MKELMTRNEMTLGECVEMARDLFNGLISRQQFLKRLSQDCRRDLSQEPYLEIIVQILQMAQAKSPALDLPNEGTPGGEGAEKDV
jgi:hypothetical protein